MTMYSLGILEKESRLLFLLRKNAQFFNGYYGLMGGKVEENEAPSTTLIREAYEEIGITISQNNLDFIHCLAFKNESQETIIAFVFKITAWHGEVFNKEPDKCSAVAWFTYDQLPDTIIPRHKLIIEKIQKSITYNETGW